jgi:hypothetical protein
MRPLGGFLGGGLILSGKRTVSPGNANLPIGVFTPANREIGVPGGLNYSMRGWREPQSCMLS